MFQQVRIDVNYATLVMNALCLDGLAAAILPDYNVLDAAKPLLQTFRRWKFLAGSVGRAFFPLAQFRKHREDRRVRPPACFPRCQPTLPAHPKPAQSALSCPHSAVCLLRCATCRLCGS